MALNHVKSGEIVDLRPLGERLPGAKTTALAKTEAFEAIRLVVPAGRDIAPHEVAGPITLHCLEGRVVLERALTAAEKRLVMARPGTGRATASFGDAWDSLKVV